MQNAIDSGILNNTRKSHEFVDFVAKLSADKGVAFNFADNKKLKETGFALEDVTVNGFVNDSGVTVNVNSAKALNSVVGHEIAHVLEGTELYDSLKSAIETYAKGKGDYAARLESLTKLYEGKEGYTGEDAAAKIQREVVADLVGDYLFTDKEFVSRLSTEHRNVFQKIFDEVKYLCRVATAGSKEARQLEKVKKVFEEAYRAEAKNPTGDGGSKYSLSIKHTDGTVEELSDARSLTNEQAIKYLQQAKSGVLQGGSYIPVRKDTPQIIIDTLVGAGENVENLSLVMQVRKAQQAMSSENPGNRTGKYGNNVRKHALSPEEVVEIVNKIDDPSMVILQTERRDKHGKPLPNNVAVFVEYRNEGNESVAVIEFDSSIPPASIGTEFGDINYHTVVTVFEPDVERNGMPYDYAEELLAKPNNYELEIKRKQPEGSATREKHPNTSKELPSSNSIRNSDEVVNTKSSLSEQGQTDTDSPFPMPWQVKGGDVALEQEEGATFPLPEGYGGQRPVAGSQGMEQGNGVFPTREDIDNMEAQRQEGMFPTREDIARMEQDALDEEYRRQASEEGYTPRLYDTEEPEGVETTRHMLEVKLENCEGELEENQRLREGGFFHCHFVAKMMFWAHLDCHVGVKTALIIYGRKVVRMLKIRKNYKKTG